MRENDPVDLCYAARKQKPRSLFPAGILLPTTVNHADAFAAAADKTLPLSDVEHGKAAARQRIIRAGKPHAASRDEHSCGSSLPEPDGFRAQRKQQRKSIEKDRCCDQISVFKIKRRERKFCCAPHDQQHQPHRPAERPCADTSCRRKRQREQCRKHSAAENDREHPQRHHVHDRRGKRDGSKLDRRNRKREYHRRDRAAERRQHGAQKRAARRLFPQQMCKQPIFRKAPVKSARKENDSRR